MDANGREEEGSAAGLHEAQIQPQRAGLTDFLPQKSTKSAKQGLRTTGLRDFVTADFTDHSDAADRATPWERRHPCRRFDLGPDSSLVTRHSPPTTDLNRQWTRMDAKKRDRRAGLHEAQIQPQRAGLTDFLPQKSTKSAKQGLRTTDFTDHADAGDRVPFHSSLFTLHSSASRRRLPCVLSCVALAKRGNEADLGPVISLFLFHPSLFGVPPPWERRHPCRRFDLGPDSSLVTRHSSPTTDLKRQWTRMDAKKRNRSPRASPWAVMARPSGRRTFCHKRAQRAQSRPRTTDPT